MFFTSRCAYRAPVVARAVQKILKIDQKTASFFSRTVSGPQLGRPDELWGNLMRVLKLRSSSTTSTQQRSTICSHRPCILDFCAPRRRHARRRARPTLPWPTLKITNAERNESSKSSTITRAPPPSSKLTPRWRASHPRCLN